MKALSNRITRLSTGPATLLGLVLFCAFIIWVLPDQAARADAATGGARSPDTSFFYTPTDLYEMADAYGADGRSHYVRARFTFDVIWPLVYLLFLATAISWSFRRFFEAGSQWLLANLMPVLGVLFDYLENISASVVMSRFPSTTPLVDWLATIFTMTKWVFVQGSFVVLIIGSAVGAVGRMRRARSAH